MQYICSTSSSTPPLRVLKPLVFIISKCYFTHYKWWKNEHLTGKPFISPRTEAPIKSVSTWCPYQLTHQRHLGSLRNRNCESHSLRLFFKYHTDFFFVGCLAWLLGFLWLNTEMDHITFIYLFIFQVVSLSLYESCLPCQSVSHNVDFGLMVIPIIE